MPESWYKKGCEDAMCMARNTLVHLDPLVGEAVGNVQRIAGAPAGAAALAPVTLLDDVSSRETQGSLSIMALLRRLRRPEAVSKSPDKTVARIIRDIRDPIQRTLVLLCIHADAAGETCPASELSVVQARFTTVIEVADRFIAGSEEAVANAMRAARPEEKLQLIAEKYALGHLTQAQFQKAVERMELTDADRQRLRNNEHMHMLGAGRVPDSVAQCVLDIHGAATGLLETYESPRMKELATAVDAEYQPHIAWLNAFQAQRGIDALTGEFFRIRDRRNRAPFQALWNTGLEHGYISELIERRREQEIDAYEACVRRLIAHCRQRGCTSGDRRTLLQFCSANLAVVHRQNEAELQEAIRAL